MKLILISAMTALITVVANAGEGPAISTKYYTIAFDTTYQFVSEHRDDKKSEKETDFKYEGTCKTKIGIEVTESEVVLSTVGEVLCTDKTTDKETDLSDYLSLNQVFSRKAEEPTNLYVQVEGAAEPVLAGKFDGQKLDINLELASEQSGLSSKYSTKITADLSTTPATFQSALKTVDTEKSENSNEETISTITIDSNGTIEPAVESEESALP